AFNPQAIVEAGDSHDLAQAWRINAVTEPVPWYGRMKRPRSPASGALRRVCPHGEARCPACLWIWPTWMATDPHTPAGTASAEAATAGQATICRAGPGGGRRAKWGAC